MNIIPNKHNINNTKLKEWLDKSDSHIKSIAHEFILKTKYISYSIFKKYLKNTYFEMLKSLNTTKLQFLIITDNSSVSYKNKSGYWVLNHIIPYIDNKIYDYNIIYDINDINYNLPIIIPDDATYSGSQISSFIEHFSNKNCDIYIMIPFISNTAIDTITTTFKENQIDGALYFPTKHKYIIKSIYELMTQDKIIKLFSYYTKDGQNVREYPIYFDHKVADNYSSFPLIYTYGIIPNQHNKNIIQMCKKNRLPLKNYFKDLQRVPILNNCSYDILYDISTPPCPLQPYKKNFVSIKRSKTKTRSGTRSMTRSMTRSRTRSRTRSMTKNASIITTI